MRLGVARAFLFITMSKLFRNIDSMSDEEINKHVERIHRKNSGKIPKNKQRDRNKRRREKLMGRGR